MKFTSLLTLVSLCLLLKPAGIIRAQETQTAAWQVTQYEINVNVTSDRSLNVRAQLTAINIGTGTGSTLTVRLNPKAEIKAAASDGASASFVSQPESKTELQRVRITLSRSIESRGTVNVTLDYRFPVSENSSFAAVSPGYAQFLPLSFWYPMVNTPFALRGADTAPFRITLSGQSRGLSGGSQEVLPDGIRFSQSLNAEPFFVVNDWDVVSGSADAHGITAHLLKGASAADRKYAEALVAFAGSARSYYVSILGRAPDASVKLIEAERGSGFTEPGTVFLDSGAVHRGKIDSSTALLISESIARLWVGGLAPIRGGGSGVLREGLVRYLSLQFLEKQYGADAIEPERLRERIAYAAIAKRDAPLSMTTPFDDTYYNAVGNKGAMIWRLVERLMGRDAFLEVLRGAVQTRKSPMGLTLADLRASVAERGGSTVKSLLDQELDQVTDMDLLVGIPQQREGHWVAALRNIGSIDADVNVEATTERGERLRTRALIPARNFSEALFTSAAKLVRVEVDPEKLYPQLDYSNDIAPRPEISEAGIADGARLMGKQDYSGAENVARQIVQISPHMEQARSLLARSLLAEGKVDEAERLFQAVLDERLPEASTIAWAKLGLGDIALRRGKAPEASKLFNEAARADAEYASALSARSARIRAETAAGILPSPDASVVAFISQLDQIIRGGRKLELEGLIVPGELEKFVKGIVGSQPELWQTRVLRSEPLSENRVAVDVQINAKQFGRDQSGTAVLILARINGNLKLRDVELFEVR